MRAARYLTTVCFLSMAAVFCISLVKVFSGWPDHSDMLATAFVSASVLTALTLVRGRRRVQIAILVVACGFSLYLAESLVRLLNLDSSVYAAAARAGVSFDRRSIIQVAQDLRSSGKDAWPRLPITQNRLAIGEKQGLIPLAGISNVWTVIGNESGRHAVTFSDEFGFNNPEGWSRRAGVRSAVLVGDSFVHGSCVESHETMTARMQARLNPAKWQVVGLGTSGASPLSELGMVVEYLRPLKPELVFWCFYENDLNQLAMEAKTGLLQYLDDPTFQQDLWHRQKEVDTFWSAWADQQMAASVKMSIRHQQQSALLSWLKLSCLRQLTQRALYKPHGNMLNETSLAMFARILGRADDEVRSWKGRLIFVYLPSYHRYTPGGQRDDTVAVHNQVTDLARQQGLAVVDLHQELFEPSQDPLGFFPFRLHGHYTAEGYDKAAERMWLRIEH